MAFFDEPGPRRVRFVHAALRRAATLGTPTVLVGDDDAAVRLARADAVVALPWPLPGPVPAQALAGLAAGKAVVVMECEATAGWPTLDPHTWQPRGHDDPRTPIAIALDPRDEEHSLVLALCRLAVDAPLRAAIGAAARSWAASEADPRRLLA